MAKICFGLAAICAGVLTISPHVALSQQSSDEQLGSVHFETSCNEVAQRRFDRAMRYQHSFWYSASKSVFEDALKADPDCTIANWGIALSLLYNPHAAPPADNLPLGLSGLQRAKEKPPKTERERDYVDSLLAFYTDYDNIDHRSRVQKYLRAVEALAQKYPNDDEAQVGLAITLNVAASPTDKSYANQLRGAAILEPLFKKYPNHPGIAHYLIHLYDYPAIAEKGLDAAQRYSQIAPAAPHAQHMPSHIFTRVGYWKESIASNIASANAAKATKEWDDGMHGMDYLVYAYLQLADDEQARIVADEMRSTSGYRRFAGHYAQAASQARYAIERGDWAQAASLEPRQTDTLYAEAVTYFARALGSARSGNPEAAATDIEKLADLRDKLRASRDAYWSEIVDIQRQIATAWMMFAQGKQDEALSAMRTAAEAEDKTEKHPVTPGPLAPARELYGAMLLERGLASEALAQYEAGMSKEPNRLNAFLGAAKAAERLGDNAKARAYYDKVASITKDTETGRPDVLAARQAIGAK